MPDPRSTEPGSRVSDPQHSQKLLRVLRTFWQEQSFHDALLVVDGEELPVQKNILAAASPYVRSETLSVHLRSGHSPDVIMHFLSWQCHHNMWSLKAAGFQFSFLPVFCHIQLCYFPLGLR